MIKILIDTCSWIDLLSQKTNNLLLDNLNYWVLNQNIEIITHEIVLQEWNKHKFKQADRFKTSLATKYKHAQEVVRGESLDSDFILEPSFENIESQISKIDEMLRRAKTLTASKDVKALSSDKSIEKLPPFHNKVDSQKDAHIIFSSLEYFNGITQEFWFISSNKNEFGSERDKETQLHPSLLEGFENTDVIYYADIGRAVNELTRILPHSLVDSPKNLNEEATGDEISIDLSMSLLEQFVQYIHGRKAELKFTPPHILANHLPLRKPNGISYYSSFSLVSDNKELIDELRIAFQEIDSPKQNQLEILNKHQTSLNEIAFYLRQNLVYHIQLQGASDDDIIDIPIIENEETSSKNCFDDLDFKRGLELLGTYKSTDQELLELAYCHYRIANFINAERLLSTITKSHPKSKYPTLKFIASFNRVKSQALIRNNFFRKHDELINDLGEIDLLSLSKYYTNKSNKKCIDWIRDRTFYTEALDQIHEIVEKIVDQYHSSDKGGWSSNYNFRLLINEYAEIVHFLNSNNVFYDRFKEFIQLSQLFFKGLIASHATSKEGGSRLHSFNDWIIHKMILYGNSDDLFKYCSHYGLKSLKYSPFPKKPLSTWVDNFLVNSLTLDKVSGQYLEDGNRAFWDYLNRIFKNLITVFALFDIESKVLNDFSAKLIVFIKSQPHLHPLSLRQLSKFLYRKGQYLKIRTLHQFLSLGIETKELHQGNFFDAVASSFRTKKQKIRLSKRSFSRLIEISFGHCKDCNSSHESTLCIGLFRSLALEDQSQTINDRIHKSLRSTFNFELYCLSSLFELIPLDDSLFDKALESCKTSRNHGSFRQFFGVPGENRLSDFDKLLNVAFKFDIDLDLKKLEHFMNYDPYYGWLIDIEHFDYSKFKAKWITDYPTKYYAKRIFSSKKTRDTVEKCLKAKFDKEIERTYLNIFIRQSWDKES